jgi:hypothetical protein
VSGQAAAAPRVYRAGIAVEASRVGVVVFDLPGCAFSALDESSAGSLMPVVVAEHIAWLDQQGEVTRDAFPFEVEVSERVDVGSLQGVADGEFCFEDDLRPVTRGELATAVARLRYSRGALLAVVRHLPDLVLDWRPPASAVRQDEWAPGVRSIRDVLRHIAGSEGYYAGNVGEAPCAGARGGEIPDLFAQRQSAIERLQALSEAELAATYRRQQPWQRQGVEHWTVRKALRRLISHEREHTREIEQQLAWLLLGPPTLASAGVEAHL